MTASMIFLIVCAALSVDLAGQPVWTLDEARPGLVVKDMLDSGQWAVPHVGGRINPNKPPLFYWPIGLTSRGGVTEWSLRFPSVVAAGATASVTYLIAAELLAPAAGLVAVAVLASSPGFIAWARTGRMEMLLTLWITLAMWSFMRWLARGRRADALGAGLWVALAVLTKGPAALIPVAAGALALIGLRGRWPGRIGDLAWGLALGGAVVVGCGTAAWLSTPDFASYVEQLTPAVIKEMRSRPSRPLGYTLRVVAVDFLPWSTALPVAAVLLRHAWAKEWRSLLPILSWAAVVLTVFWVAIDARPPYVLSIYPPLALLVAYSVRAPTGRGIGWLAVPPALAFAGLAGFGLYVALGSGSVRVHDAWEPVPPWVGIAIACISAAVLIGGFNLIRSSRPVAATLVAAAGMLVAVLLFDVTVRTPAANASFPTPRLAERLAGRLPRDAEVVYVDSRRVTALLFYLPHRLHQVSRPEEIIGMLGCGRRSHALVGESAAAMLGDALGARLRRVDAVSFGGVVYVLVGVEEADPGPARDGTARCPPETRQRSRGGVSSTAS